MNDRQREIIRQQSMMAHVLVPHCEPTKAEKRFSAKVKDVLERIRRCTSKR